MLDDLNCLLSKSTEEFGDDVRFLSDTELYALHEEICGCIAYHQEQIGRATSEIMYDHHDRMLDKYFSQLDYVRDECIARATKQAGRPKVCYA